METADGRPSQIRSGPDGPVVLEQPSSQWVPVMLDGAPAALPAATSTRSHGSAREER